MTDVLAAGPSDGAPILSFESFHGGFENFFRVIPLLFPHHHHRLHAWNRRLRRNGCGGCETGGGPGSKIALGRSPPSPCKVSDILF